MNNTFAFENNKQKEVNIKTWQLFLIITVLSLLVSFAFQKFIMTREVYYTLYGGQMEKYRIDDFISLIRKLQIWGYIATPLIIWLRIAFVSFLIQLPFMLKYIELPFKDIFRIVAIAYSVFLAADVTRFFYLYFQQSGNISFDMLSFIPLSITNFLDKSNYSDLSFAFLSKINLFELLWGVVVYIGLVKTKKKENIDCALIIFGVWLGILALSFGLSFFIGVIS